MARTLRVLVLVLFVVPALLLPWSASAQPAGEEALRVPWITGALADDALAPTVNPAGLNYLRGSELQLLIMRVGRDTEDEARTAGFHWGGDLGGLGLGFSMDWLRGEGVIDLRRTRLALALGGRGGGLGLGVNWFATDLDPELDAAESFDVGLSGRPTSFLGFSVAARDLGTDTRTRLLSYGLAVRLLRGRVELGADQVWAPGQSPFRGEGRVEAGLRLAIARGLTGLGGLSWSLDDGRARGQLGLAVDLEHLGAAFGVGPDDTYGQDGILAVRSSTARHPSVIRPRRTVLLELDQALNPPAPLIALTERTPPLLDVLLRLDRMRRDETVSAVVLRAGALAPLDLAEAEELRHAVGALQAAGKRVVFHLEGADDAVYYLASAGDAVLAAPGATFLVNGLTTTTAHFGEGLSKIGVNPEFEKIGTYKSAPERFTRDTMSEAEREMVEAILDDVFGRYVRTVASERGLTPEAFRQVLDRGLLDAEAAHQAGLVNQVVWTDELERVLPAHGARAPLDRTWEALPTEDGSWGLPPTVAVIPIEGTIAPGESPGGPFVAGVVGADTVARAVERAVRDPSVRAILVRIDSPGGDAAASDRIWRALRQADARKPVVASLGPVAASGGYYAAAGAREILGAPSSLTGSIGIFAGHVDLSGLLDRLGIRLTVLERGELADVLGAGSAWTETDRAAVRAFIDSGYRRFVQRVAASRPLSPDEVDALGQGRVWTGAQARAGGLIDAEGTFLEAVEAARRHAGLPADVPVEVRFVAGGPPFPARLASRSGPLGRALEAPLPPALEAALRPSLPTLWVLAPGRPLALLPYRIEVR